MKILSDAENAAIKILVVILVAALIVCVFWKFSNNNYTRPTEGESVQVVHDTAIVHDTVVDVHAITKTVTVHDTIYITD